MELIWISGLALLVHVFVTWLLVYKLKVGFVGIAITFGFSWDGCFISGIKGYLDWNAKLISCSNFTIGNHDSQM